MKLFHLFKNTITVIICHCKDGKLSGCKCPSSHWQRAVGTNVVGTSDRETVTLGRLPSSLDQWLKETTLEHFFLNTQTSFPKQHWRNYQQKIELRSKTHTSTAFRQYLAIMVHLKCRSIKSFYSKRLLTF